MRIVACFQYFNLILQELVKLAYLILRLPLIMSLRMDLMATTSSVSWCRPLNTSPNWPLPILSYSTYLSITFGIYK